MISKQACSVLALVATLIPAGAFAHTGAASGTAVPRNVRLVPALRLADVVVNPNPAPAPVAAPAAVPVAAPAPAVVEAPTRRSTTVVENGQHRSYMSTIAISALMGGVAGALVGGSLYFLADDQTHGRRIAYWAAGGVLVGATVGIVQVSVEESRADRMVATHLPTDPAPTLRLALYSTRF